ncbi:outer membrane lipoprotein carrier protein LolA [Actinomycetospora endophytica]|uniref:Outer membrane lipoprotein carrier protein LolA n=1 Tax=Actinomycetospora endophytica TaxID=2291215 RepID=A0ABS8PGW7_9PSEU|nr:outer membrane lipoprotein carrier protein LolA [Actinomycetospora endophytica]MCD2197278.1 outer membrane lipoprotein carrier protein LolA [Actinomycetospora endophytica]
MSRRGRWGAGLAGIVVAGAVAVGVAVAPTAAAAPPLPPVTPEALAASVITAKPGPMNGTVTVDNELGLPAIPQVPQLGNGTSTVRVWSNGDGKGRAAIPSPDGERTLVSDGTTRWSYDSTDRTVTKAPAHPANAPAHPGRPGGVDPQTDPSGAATQMIADLRKTSTVTVDGTTDVAGRSAYQLVLTPLPTERTLLREVRVAVDAEKRIPLQLTVLATGSPQPALTVGFSDITFGPQDQSLFTFTPPPGTAVKDAPARGPGGQSGPPQGAQAPKVVGDGWDRVIVAQKPATRPNPNRDEGDAPDLSALGTPVSGPWGQGRLISTAVATAIVTNDGRIAAGAVPEQVLSEALGR